jgi:hypothetical protein
MLTYADTTAVQTRRPAMDMATLWTWPTRADMTAAAGRVGTAGVTPSCPPMPGLPSVRLSETFAALGTRPPVQNERRVEDRRGSGRRGSARSVWHTRKVWATRDCPVSAQVIRG